MEVYNSTFSAFLVEENEAGSVASSTREMTCFTASILWEIREN